MRRITGLLVCLEMAVLWVTMGYAQEVEFLFKIPAQPAFSAPFGIAIGPDGSVWITDNILHQMVALDPKSPGVELRVGSLGSSYGQFLRPSGIAADADGNIYVADTGNFRIQKFSSDGTFLTRWGLPGGGAGQFYRPSCLAVDAAGLIYVADTFNARAQIFTQLTER